MIVRRAVLEWLLTDNAGYHTAGVGKASSKSLGPNKVKVSMCKQSFSLAIKDNKERHDWGSPTEGVWITSGVPVSL